MSTSLFHESEIYNKNKNNEKLHSDNESEGVNLEDIDEVCNKYDKLEERN
jgi:hypothetical protein